MHPLKAFLEKKEISAAEFARRIRTSAPYVSQVINGRRHPSREMARKISDATGGVVSAAELLLWERPAA